MQNLKNNPIPNILAYIDAEIEKLLPYAMLYNDLLSARDVIRKTSDTLNNKTATPAIVVQSDQKKTDRIYRTYDNDIIKLNKDGMTVRQISKRLGISYPTTWSAHNRLNLPKHFEPSKRDNFKTHRAIKQIIG